MAKNLYEVSGFLYRKNKNFGIFSEKDAEVFLYCYITNFTATQRFFSRW